MRDEASSCRSEDVLCTEYNSWLGDSLESAEPLATWSDIVDINGSFYTSSFA